jgi:hypothetical protein
MSELFIFDPEYDIKNSLLDKSTACIPKKKLNFQKQHFNVSDTCLTVRQYKFQDSGILEIQCISYNSPHNLEIKAQVEKHLNHLYELKKKIKHDIQQFMDNITVEKVEPDLKQLFALNTEYFCKKQAIRTTCNLGLNYHYDRPVYLLPNTCITLPNGVSLVWKVYDRCFKKYPDLLEKPVFKNWSKLRQQEKYTIHSPFRFKGGEFIQPLHIGNYLQYHGTLKKITSDIGEFVYHFADGHTLLEPDLDVLF